MLQNTGCNANLVDIADKRSEYVKRLEEVREILFGDDSIAAKQN
jgi:hypothetical protein